MSSHKANSFTPHLICPDPPKPIHYPISRLCPQLLVIILLNNLLNSIVKIRFDNYCQVKYFKLKTTGEIIREQREKKGLLLRQVAALLDIDTAILSKIERGERKANREQIAKLADILGLNKDELLIQYLGEKIAYEIADNDLAKEVLLMAEEKVTYLKAHKKK